MTVFACITTDIFAVSVRINIRYIDCVLNAQIEKKGGESI